MSLPGPPPLLRPMELAQKLDIGTKLWSRNLRALCLCALVFVAPMMVITALVQLSVSDHPFGSGAFGDSSDDNSSAGTIVQYVTLLLAMLLVQVACSGAVGQALRQIKPQASEAIGSTLRRAHSLLWIATLYLLLLAPGVVLITGLTVAVGPGFLTLLAVAIPFYIWLYFSLMFAVQALTIEDLRGVAALRRSFSLVKGHWWSTFGTWLVQTFLVGIVQLPLSLVLLALVFVDNDLAATVLGGVVYTIVYTLTLPLSASIITLIYFDLRIRREGFDVELLVATVGNDVPSPFAGPQRLTPAPAPSSDGGFAPPPAESLGIQAPTTSIGAFAPPLPPTEAS